MAACPHVASAGINVPAPTAQIYKDECSFCYDSPDNEGGLDVCLTCFVGGCTDPERYHNIQHSNKTGHPLALNIKRVKKPKIVRDGEEPPQKITKIAIVPEKDEDLYEYFTAVKCHECGSEVDKSIPRVVDAIMTSLSASRQSEIKAWEEEIVSCDHIRNLVQDQEKIVSAENAHCANCDLNENLWLCLVCGNLGCGRQQYGGAGGNGHGLAHFEATGHGVACKLGTITPEGTADIYCYHCNEERSDEDLGVHLARFGIKVENQVKSIKSLTELSLEQNQNFNFNMYTEDGKSFEPLFGPGYTGFKNLGNRYYPVDQDHLLECNQEPGKCLQCQLAKVADGLLSGRYSAPIESDGGEIQGQDGIAPGMFKALIGRGHPEFSTMRQQDSFEFFQHLVKIISQSERISSQDPTKTFEFSNEQRLQCNECKKVRYSHDKTTALSIVVPARKKSSTGEEDKYESVTFEECMSIYVAEETLPYNCPSCQKNTTASKTNRFATFPEVLVINMRRFAYQNWVPRKLGMTFEDYVNLGHLNNPVPIVFPNGKVDLERYRGHGQQPNEELLPEDALVGAGQATGPTFDETALEQLQMMGFPLVRCQKALLATGNQGSEVAMDWLIQHMEDPDIDTPISFGGSDQPSASPEQIAQLADMGFSEKQAKKALKETGGSMERAVEWLFSHMDEPVEDETETTEPSTSGDSKALAGDVTKQGHYELASFISHKGPSVHCGHYVSHIRRNGQWVLFNDNKVVVDPTAPVGDAYMYIFKRE
ncbi:hypothetical protein BGW38_002258 [Lunasporangiospora selenospora]|uniref:Ubiquitin carboxyl-terminal hydrolase 14 n=1 Tax=Lunasporangiospora selenospora TaxID=979761 RepID=A0A9P6G1R0_9FUNG|nr:hypothetical protein BGW38_002258 [Lunasporangiospora selenospora]